MAVKSSLIRRFLIWRVKNIDDKKFMIFLSILIGVVVGFAAVIIKNSVHLIQNLLTNNLGTQDHNYMYFAYPAIGILLVLIFTKYIIHRPVGHGIPTTLYAISKNNGKIKKHNMFSSIIASAFTVGFGGSVGLEGPTVATGAAWGSNISHFFRLNFRQVTLLLACASAGAMSAIFKAPIAAIVFVLEVIMLDLTLSSLLPLLFASVSAVITSYTFLGMDKLYPIEITQGFDIGQIHYYILLGILTGLVSVYFSRTYKSLQKWFDRQNNSYSKWIVGVSVLGILIFLFPALYGEGYESINGCLSGNHDHLFNNSLFFNLQNNIIWVFVLFVLVILLKAVATSVTFGAGGVGGIFAPTLFIGANTGLMFANIFAYLGIINLSNSNFALVGMVGLIAGVLHAPLTAIFLIAEITGGYDLIMPLMIGASVSFATTRIFERYSVYTYQLARRGELFTHDKDKVVLSILKVTKLIETDFLTINPEASLGDLIKVISESKRNIVPVTDDDNNLQGIVFINDIRNIMFKPERYDSVYVKELMFMPSPTVSSEESMEDIAKKFQQTSHYNLPVIDNGKYVGFVSRANVFSAYRNLLKKFSED
ncbi:MAG: chloride channel protein [Bacteroidales bacterium]|nr:chloride channel protein [Bacteroidales bacterium]